MPKPQSADKNELEKKEENLPAAAPNFAADAGQGLEGTDKNAFAIPFITILQGLSPQLETVEGARPGLFINVITNQIMKEVVCVPCAYQRRFLRWEPRELGGGYRGELNPIDVETGKVPNIKTDDEGRMTIDGDELKDTRHHYVLVQTETGSWQPALISLASTQIKKSKRWMSRIQGIELRDEKGKTYTPPSFSHIYRLTTVKEENQKGSWWSLNVVLTGPVQDAELYNKAKAFHNSVVAGTVVVAEPTAEATSGGGGDIPF